MKRTSQRIVSQKIKDEQIIELYNTGLSNREIAEILKVTQSAINYRMQRLELKNNCWKENRGTIVCPHCQERIGGEKDESSNND